MKPSKTQARKEVRELSKQLQGLTFEQTEFCNTHYFRGEHRIYHLKSGGQAWCTYCGATGFKIDKDAETCTCPKCGHTFKSESSTKKVFRGHFGYSAIFEVVGDWQVIRYVCSIGYSRKGKYDYDKGWQDGTAGHYQFDFLRKWINVYNGIIVTERTYVGMLANYRDQPYSYSENPSVTSHESYWTSEWFKKFVHKGGRIHKELRRKGLTLKRISEWQSSSELVSLVCKNPYAETLLKRRQNYLLDYWVSLYDYRQYGGRKEDTFAKYKDSIRIALKNGVVFGKDKVRIGEYMDYLKELDMLHRDLHSPHYLAPADFHKAHSETSKLCQRIREQIWERERLERARKNEEKLKARVAPYKELCLTGFGLECRPLLSVEEFFEEGKAMHHCVGGYTDKEDCLILSARIDGKRIETIELRISDWSIVQSRGLQNKSTKHHKDIIKLMTQSKPTLEMLKKEGQRMAVAS